MNERRNGTGTDHGVMRELNRSLVLDVVKHSDGPVSRAGIARETNLAKPTVSGIIEDLLEEGLVRELGPGQSASNGGRPPILLEYNARSRFIGGIRIGVGHTDLVVADAMGNELARKRVTTPGGAAVQALRSLGRSLRDLLRAESAIRRLDAVGVSIPGLIDMASGRCLLAPNLGWRDVAVAEVLGEQLNRPVYVINTVQAALVVESLEGAARGAKNVVMLYVGRGLGSAVLSDGRIVHGSSGLAGEIGHCHVPGATQRCNCGKVGCLETIADGPAIARHATRLLGEGRRSTLSDVPTEELTAQRVAEAAVAGDDLATQVYREAGEALGLAASWLINLFNPDILLIGGGVAEAGELVLGPLRATAMQHTLPHAAERVHIRAWTHGYETDVTGAVRVAMQNSESYYRVIFQGGGEDGAASLAR